MREKMRSKILIILIVLVLITLNGCKSSLSNVIEDNSCLPPCWKGIVPGETNRQEALSIITKLPDVNQSNIKTGSIITNNDSISWNFPPRTGDKYGYIFIDNDLVFGLGFVPDKNALPLDAAIKYLGDPESIIAIYNQAEVPYLVVYFMWQSKGIVLASHVESFHYGDLFDVNPKTQISSFWYFQPELFEKMMTSFYVANLDSTILSLNTHPWTGYEDITSIIVEQR
jgi:hypothetical protein